MPYRLLLADDSVTIQKVIELTFADENVTVVAVDDGDQAIARLQAEPFDIVLADVGMPGKDGYEVASFLRDRPGPKIPVLLLTGAFDLIDEQRIAAAGASAVLAKPFEPQVLVARVRALLSGVSASGEANADEQNAGSSQKTAASPSSTLKAPTVDDYFERLDRAFANLNVTAEPPAPQTPAAEPPASVTEHRAEDSSPATLQTPSTGAASPPDAPARSSRPSEPARPGLAERFATLLAIEQGELPASALAPAPASAEDDLVDRIARRVVEQLGDQAVRELAADIVSRTAERLVREEIQRIKGN
jgi:DNA-binding response OmpR family regulator